MVLRTPIVLTVRSKDTVRYTLKNDGTATMSYCFPDPFEINEPHAVKLLYVHGTQKPVYVKANFIELQGFNMDPVMLLGTSIPGSNVYVPVRTNYITAVGWFTLAHLDGTPIDHVDNISLALHLVPQSSLPSWHQ